MNADSQAPRPPSLKSTAYTRLKQLILNGEVKPGAVLSVRQLAEQLNMSKTPVHAALERMEVEGLVEFAPQQGVFVRQVSQQDIVNHYEIREALERFVVEKLVGQLSSEQISRLEKTLQAQRDAAGSGQTQAYLKADAEFHFLLSEFSGNLDFSRVLRRSTDRVFQVLAESVAENPQWLLPAIGEHQAILDAIVKGDRDQALDLITHHIRLGYSRYSGTAIA